MLYALAIKQLHEKHYSKFAKKAFSHSYLDNGMKLEQNIRYRNDILGLK